jgi:NAD(P)-dependent dehydrogenase (short-subunit alcohol dehydrogenase family)
VFLNITIFISQELAETILFLATVQASWLTATILPIDGGMTARREAALI